MSLRSFFGKRGKMQRNQERKQWLFFFTFIFETICKYMCIYVIIHDYTAYTL